MPASAYDLERYGRWADPPRCDVQGSGVNCPNRADFVLRYPTIGEVDEHMWVCSQCLTSSLRVITRSRGPVVVEQLP